MEIELNASQIILNRMKEDKKVLKYLESKKKWEKQLQIQKWMCINRLFSNVFYEIFSFSCLLVYLIVFSKWLDGDIQMKHSKFVWLLLPISVEYGIIPYIQLFFKFTVKKKGYDDYHKEVERYKSSCNGIFNIRMFISLWNPILGIRILSHGCLFISFILYVLYAYEVINLSYCFFPLAIYSILFELTFAVSWNIVSCPEGFRDMFTFFRIYHFLLVYSSIAVSCILTIIRLLGITTWMYTTLSIPWCISFLFIPIANMSEYFTSCWLYLTYCSSEDGTTRLDDAVGIDNFFEKNEADCWRSLIDTGLFSMFSPLLITSIILFTLRVESIVTFSYIYIFIPLFLVVVIIIILNLISMFIVKAYRCPYFLCPDSFGLFKKLFCCVGCSKRYTDYEFLYY